MRPTRYCLDDTGTPVLDGDLSRHGHHRTPPMTPPEETAMLDLIGIWLHAQQALRQLSGQLDALHTAWTQLRQARDELSWPEDQP